MNELAKLQSQFCCWSLQWQSYLYSSINLCLYLSFYLGVPLAGLPGSFIFFLSMHLPIKRGVTKCPKSTKFHWE